MKQRLAEAIDEAMRLLRRAVEQDDPALVDAAVARLEAASERGCEPGGDPLDEARAEIRRRDEFLSVVAHELRNPISPLVFTTDILLRQARSGRLPDEQTLLKHLTMFRQQLDRLTVDLSRLLDFSRFQSGRLDLQRERVDLVAVVREAVEELRPQLEASRCETRLSAPPTLDGWWDRMRLRQVAWNLLSNAAKFGASAPIEVFITARDDQAELTVADHGPGVPEHDRERIFHRFEQLSSSQARTGFGVGLWVVRRIVEASGGTMALESAPGAGARFTVLLPRRIHG